MVAIVGYRQSAALLCYKLFRSLFACSSLLVLDCSSFILEGGEWRWGKKNYANNSWMKDTISSWLRPIRNENKRKRTSRSNVPYTAHTTVTTLWRIERSTPRTIQHSTYLLKRLSCSSKIHWLLLFWQLVLLESIATKSRYVCGHSFFIITVEKLESTTNTHYPIQMFLYYTDSSRCNPQ